MMVLHERILHELGSMIGQHIVKHLLQISLFFSTSSRYKFRGQGIKNISFFQFTIVQHDPQRGPGGAEQGRVPPGNVYETFP